jgi:hypothetical protein
MLGPPSAFQFALDLVAAISRAILLSHTSSNKFRAAPLAHSRPPTLTKEQIQRPLETAHPSIMENAFIPIGEKLCGDYVNV